MGKAEKKEDVLLHGLSPPSPMTALDLETFCIQVWPQQVNNQVQESSQSSCFFHITDINQKSSPKTRSGRRLELEATSQACLNFCNFILKP